MNEITDVRLFKESDLYLVPFCLALLYIIAYRARLKYKNDTIRHYFFPALSLRFFFGVVFALIIQYYYGYGDTIMYYRATQDMHRAVDDQFSNLFYIFQINKLSVDNPIYVYFTYDGGTYTDLYMRNSSNFAVPQFALPFSLIFSKSYLCITFCICLYSFAGCWRLFKTFYYLYPALQKKAALSILFLPSILFWSEGLAKDSICIGALGFVAYAVYKIFIQRNNIVISILMLVFNGWILFNIKSYILMAFMLALVIAAFMVLNRKITNTALRTFSAFFFIAIALVSGYFLVDTLAGFESSSQFATENIIQTVQGVQSGFETTQGEGSYFKVGKVGNDFESLLPLFPLGIFTTLFRPFIWEIQNPLMFFSALESLAFLILTIMTFRRIGIRKSFRYVFSDSITLLCLIFTIVFAGFVGITTFNFGSLARYKIPCLPFYLMMLFIVMQKSGKFSSEYIFSKRFF